MPLQVVALPHPFRLERTMVALPAGGTIAELMVQAGADRALLSHGVVEVDGWPVPREAWARVRPKPGRVVTIRVLPMGGGGGGGKSALRIVLSIAVMVAAAWAGPALATLAGFQAGSLGFAVVSGLASAAVTMVGGLIVNAIAPPAGPRLSEGSGALAAESTSPTLSITGASNRANAYGPVPRLYGRHRIFPLYAAQPYSELVGEEQYLNLLFDCGYGPLQLSDHRIGTVPLADYRNVELAVHEGWTTGTALKLFRNDVDQDGYAALIGRDSGPVTVETRGPADEIQVELGFAQGLFAATGAGTAETAVSFRVEYREVGGGQAFEPALAVDGATAETLVVPEVEAAAETYHCVYRTEVPVVGPARITLACPTGRWFGSNTIAQVRYIVQQRAVGESAWTTVLDMRAANTWLYPGQSATHDLPGRDGVRREFRVERAGHYITENAPLNSAQDSAAYMGANGRDGNPAARAFPAPTWSYRTPAQLFTATVEVRANRRALVRHAITLRPPRRARWQVRIVRLTPDRAQTENIFDQATLVALRTIRFEPPIALPERHTIIELRIRASEQLQGVVQEYNVVAQAVLPVWRDGQWVEEPTRNPAWAFCDLFMGSACARPLPASRLMLDDIAAWAAACDATPPATTLPGAPAGATASNDSAEPSHAFDLVFDTRGTLLERARDVAAAGRAAFGMRDGRYTVIRDVPQSVPVQHFTPRNSWGFKGRKMFGDLPDGLKVRFVNPAKDWQQDEVIVYADGFGADGGDGLAVATVFETIEMPGCTSAAQAWRAGRYHMAVARLRPETWELSADVEHLVCRRGDLVRVSHDVPRWGLGQGRISAVTVDGGATTAIGLDEPVPMAAGQSHAVRIRTATGASILANVVTVAGLNETLTFATPISGPTQPGVGDLFMFGLQGLESVELIVKEIRRGPDLSAVLTLLDAAPAVHTAETAALPVFDTQATRGDALAAPPPAPVDLVASETVTQDGRAARSEVVLAWRQPSGGLATAWEVHRRIAAGPWVLLTVTPTRTARLAVEPALLGRDHLYAVVAVAPGGGRLAPEASALVALRPAARLPAPGQVRNLRAELGDGMAMLTWEAPAPALDAGTVDAYEVVITLPVSAGASLGGVLAATQVHQVAGTAKTVPIPLAGTYGFSVRALNVQGHPGAPAALTVQQSRPWAANAVAEESVSVAAGSFTGTLGRGGAGQIRRPSLKGAAWTIPAAAHDAVVFNGPWDLAQVDSGELGDVDSSWLVGPTLTETGEWRSAIIDLGTAISGVWHLDYHAEVLDYAATEHWDDVNSDAVAELDSDLLAAGQASVEVVLRLGLAADLADGREVTVWDGEARYAQVIVRARARSWVMEALVEDITIRCDAPDVTDGGQAVLSATPQTFAFARAFAQAPAVTITALNGAAVQLTAVTALDFTVAGTAGDIVNWHAKGI